MIVIPSDLVNEIRRSKGSKDVQFFSHDDGDVFTVFTPSSLKGNVQGSLIWTEEDKPIVGAVGKDLAKIKLVVSNNTDAVWQSSAIGNLKVHGYVRCQNSWKQTPVQIVPVKEELFSRLGGLFETDVLFQKRVFILGQGSGGSQITLELVKSGIGKIDMMDHDRLEVGNLVRHAAFLKDIGRYKTKVMDEMIQGKNPEVEVRTWEEKVSWESIDVVREIIKQADIVICATDNQPSKLIVNRLCVEEKKPCIFAGAFRRAYGGQILFVKPNVTPCYQCFLMLLPEQTQDQEISSHRQAEGLAYTDRPVPIEPGLSTDIAPIGLMVVKLAIQELLKGTETTLRSLDEDLVASWYLWLNRREQGTQYESLRPLEYNIDGMHVLRWYGVAFERHPGCPVCGNFEGYQIEAENMTVPIFDDL
jgi:molybdopterin/thiamine biosynthesis adenylyltransferase